MEIMRTRTKKLKLGKKQNN